jgi:hypothetical protein
MVQVLGWQDLQVWGRWFIGNLFVHNLMSTDCFKIPPRQEQNITHSLSSTHMQVALWSSTHFPKQASDWNQRHWACKRQTADVQQPWRILHQSHKWGCKTLPMVHFSSLGTASNNQQWWNYPHNGVSSMQQKEKLVIKTTSHGQQTTSH